LGPGSPAARLPGTCRPVLLPSQAESAQWFAAGRAGYSWRFRIPDTMPISFTECVLSLRSFLPGRDLGDFPVGRRDNFAAYQPATLVDDASPERPANAIGKVARGADLLLSTARQLLLFVALGHAAPAFLIARWCLTPMANASPSGLTRFLSSRFAARGLRRLGSWSWRTGRPPGPRRNSPRIRRKAVPILPAAGSSAAPFSSSSRPARSLH
jgi:hypothetical protein